MARFQLLTALALATSSAAAAQRTTAGITAADARRRLSIIADDSMRGRLAGDIGNVRATDYVAAEVRRLGLTPGGERGSFFQTVPLRNDRLAAGARLFGGGVDLRIGRDFTVAIQSAGGRPFALDSARVIYGGALDDTSQMISAAQARGHVVILGPKMVNGVRETVRRPGEKIGNRFSGIPAIFFAQIDSVGVIAADLAPSVSLRVADGALVPATLAGSITLAAASKLFGRPIAALHAGDTGIVVHSSVRMLNETPPYPARNVIAVLRGSDPKLAGEYVVIGAHTDHLGVTRTPLEHDSVWAYSRVFRPHGFGSPDVLPPTPERTAQFHQLLDSLRRVRPPRPDSINNGADDDASGSVALLEIAQAMAGARVRPRRSVVFAWFTAEEVGYLGSYYFVEHATIPRDSIVAELQMDQVSRGNARDMVGGSERLLYLVAASNRSTELGGLIVAVNAAEPDPFAIDLSYDAPNQPDRLFCRSDQWYFSRRGIPVALFFTGWHPDQHQVTDEVQETDPAKLARVARLVYDVAVRVANRPSPLVRDRPGPDLSIVCR